MRLTLNLLPPDKKKALRSGVILTFVQSMTLIVCVAALVFAVNFAYANIWLSRESEELGKVSVDVGGEFSAITDDAGAMRGYLEEVRRFSDDFTPWSSVIASVSGALGPGITLDRLAFDRGTVVIEGTAATRDDVLSAKGRLEKLPFAKNVDSPLSNILQRANARFSFTVAIDPSSVR